MAAMFLSNCSACSFVSSALMAASISGHHLLPLGHHRLPVATATHGCLHHLALLGHRGGLNRIDRLRLRFAQRDVLEHHLALALLHFLHVAAAHATTAATTTTTLRLNLDACHHEQERNGRELTERHHRRKSSCTGEGLVGVPSEAGQAVASRRGR
jgi:hypothetical protein